MFTELSVLYAKYRPEKRESTLLSLSLSVPLPLSSPLFSSPLLTYRLDFLPASEAFCPAYRPL